MTQAQRQASYYHPDLTPKRIRCYDNGGRSIDNFTVVFTGRYRHKTGGEFWHLAMNAQPFHLLGFCQHGSSLQQIDYPTYGHLGRKIRFTDLPEDCQKLVRCDYAYLNDVTDPTGGSND